MKFRNTGSEKEKIEAPMAPMIDVVFQLLIFFMLTLKIVEPEGDFNINMPLGAPTPSPDQLTDLPPVKVRLLANEDGSLAQIVLGQRQLGSGENAFLRLNNAILEAIGGRPGNPLAEELEVEIDADYNLQYEYSLRAMSACTGRLAQDPETGQPRVIRYVENIKFTPPKRPGS